MTNSKKPVTVRLPDDVLKGLEQFRREQEDIPSNPEAIRRILRDWLIGSAYIPVE